MSLPARQYDLAAALLAGAVNDAVANDVPVREALARAAETRGRRLGEHALMRAGSRPSRRALLDAVVTELAAQGYEPRAHEAHVALANCPFHALVDGQRELICGMNLDLLGGMAKAVGRNLFAARLDPESGRCCVILDTSVSSN